MTDWQAICLGLIVSGVALNSIAFSIILHNHSSWKLVQFLSTIAMMWTLAGAGGLLFMIAQGHGI